MRFKLYSQNFDLIKISAQKYIIFLQDFGRTEKYLNLCRDGKGTSVIGNYVPPRGKSETGFRIGKGKKCIKYITRGTLATKSHVPQSTGMFRPT